MLQAQIEQLKDMEGFRQKPYKDTRGILTIGYGTNLECGISEKQASALLLLELQENRRVLETCGWFNTLDIVRQGVIENMAYQLGTDGLFMFRHMISCLSDNDYQGAATEMLNSRWATQTPNRAIKLASIMRSGAMEP